MKIHDFGLWFNHWFSNKWSTTIPETDGFFIYYDGHQIGRFNKGLLYIDYNETYKLRFKGICDYNYSRITSGEVDLGRRLTLDDFFIEKVVYELVWTVGREA